MGQKGIVRLLSAAALVMGTCSAYAQYVLGGPDCGIASASSVWCWGESGLESYRTALESPGNFGAGGVVGTAITTVDLAGANFTSSLGSVNGLVVPWWSSSDASPYVNSVTNFFKSGGDLFILADNAGNDPINANLGVPTTSTGAFSITRPTSGTAPLYGGPFGVAASVEQTFSGELRPADVLLTGGKIVGTDATGRVVAAVWDKDVYAPGAGRMVVVTDVDMLAFNDFAVQSDRTRFGLNAAAWLVEGGPVQAETTPSYLLAAPACSLTTVNSYCFSSQLANVKSALEEPVNFGPDGTVKRRILTEDVTDFDPATLAKVDGIVVPWWADNEAAPYADAIRNALLMGKDVFLLQDDFLHDRVGESIGIPTTPFDPADPCNLNFIEATTGSGPLYDGPFGFAAVVNQFANHGGLDPAIIAALGGTIDGRNSCHEITGAYWLDGLFGPDSGRLIVVTDVDMLSSAHFASSFNEYAIPSDDNARFALNAFALLTAPASSEVSEPGTLSLLLGLMSLLLLPRLVSQQRPPASSRHQLW